MQVGACYRAAVAVEAIGAMGELPGEDPAGADLPGLGDIGVDGDGPVVEVDIDFVDAGGIGCGEGEAATVREVGGEGLEEAIPESKALPLAVAPVDGLVGGEAGRQVAPGEVVADFVEDGVEDENVVEGRAAAQGGRGWGEEGVEEEVLGGGEHGEGRRLEVGY